MRAAVFYLKISSLAYWRNNVRIYLYGIRFASFANFETVKKA